MTKFDSKVKRVSGYWSVRYDESNGWENGHIHVSQGGRAIQIYTGSLSIKNQNGKFSNEEIQELQEIAREYDGKKTNT